MTHEACVRLANGLNVELIHASRLTRSAALLRVNAGSHDAPTDYPGLAHFLEHLLFLESVSFPAGQGLIPFVQAQGGQVNACTRERFTEYFFEVSLECFEAGLERLCDMLARPTLALRQQESEREVLHAEFLAWSNGSGRTSMALNQALPGRHPLGRFHAGNRYSLPIHQPAFQQALLEFHQRFYHSGQMTLVLAGPQSVEKLRSIAERCAQVVRCVDPVVQEEPPSLFPLRMHRVTVPRAVEELSLVFCFEGLVGAVDDALECLCFWLAQEDSGNWYGALLERGWIETLSVCVPYRHQDQASIQIDIRLEAAGVGRESEIVSLLFDWLGFFSSRADLRWLHATYASMTARKLDAVNALGLARHRLSRSSRSSPESIATVLAAMRAVIDQLRPEQLIQIRSPSTEGAEPPTFNTMRPCWFLPSGNPFLAAEDEQPLARATPIIPHFKIITELSSLDGSGALFLRWRSSTPAAESRLALIQMQRQLAPLIRDATQAGMSVRLDGADADWELAISGRTKVIPLVLAEVLKASVDQSRARLRQLRSQHVGRRAGTLIHQLMDRLDDVPTLRSCLDIAETDIEPQFWQRVPWDGLAVGIAGDDLARTMGLLLGDLGQAAALLPRNPESRTGHRWRHVDISHSENALLLFCAQTDRSLESVAVWRLLAQLIQGPFYQRLRGELKIGYGVFSSYRTVAGWPGILFGVQSPNVSGAEILQHMEQFFSDVQQHLAALDQRLLLQFCASIRSHSLDFQEAAQLHWHSHKYGQGRGLRPFHDALSGVTRSSLVAEWERIRGAAGGWFCVANSSPPDSRWIGADSIEP